MFEYMSALLLRSACRGRGNLFGTIPSAHCRARPLDIVFSSAGIQWGRTK